MAVKDAERIDSLANVTDVETSEFWEQIREKGDMYWDEGVQAYLVSSYEMSTEMARMDNNLWHSPLAPHEGYVPYGMSEDAWWEYTCSRYRVTSMIGEGQRELHRWWLMVYSRKDLLKAWEQDIVIPMSHRAIDRFIDDGRAELAADYTMYVGPRVILGILGLPNTDDAWLEELHQTIHVAAELLSYTGTPPAETIEKCTQAALHMQEMMAPYILEKRDGTGDDFISRVWAEADELFGEGEWEDHDIVEIAALSFLAASETTVGTTASALYLLLKHPELQDTLRADPSLTPRFIEETMRLHSQISFRPRIAAQDLELGGVAIEKGQMVISLQESVNRDPEHYECPHQVKLDRQNPYDHFGFWRGPRQCPGRPLARLEMQTFVDVLLERVRDLRLDPDAPPPIYEGLLLRRWAPLNVLFTPADA